MQLAVEELKSEVETRFSVEEITNLVAIRPHLFKKGSPAGSLFLELHSENGLIATSETIQIDEIPGTHFHGMIRFYIDKQLRPNHTYTIKLKSTGYTFSESTFVAWVSDFDSTSYPSNSAYPLASAMKFELWKRKQI